MAFIDGTALNVVLPALQQSLNASAADLFWLLNAYLLVLAALILVGGSLGDKLGRKKVFMAGIFVFICGSALCGLANNITWLIIFRVLQGLGGAFMIPGSLSLISSTINPKERGKAIGTWSAFTTVVTMGGPILGGAFADAGLWRYIFFINIPIGIVALLILWNNVAESREVDENPSIDIWGAFTIALGLAMLTFGFLRMPALGLQHWQTAGSITMGIAFLIVFVLIEKTSKYPMMPLNLFKNMTFTGANLLTLFLYAGLGAAMLFMGLNMVQAQGYSQLQSGLSFLPFTLLMVGVARFAGALAYKYGPRLFLTGGPALAAVGLLILSFVKQTSGPAAYWTSFFPGILLFGLGMSFTVSPLTATVMGSVSEHFSGVASGVNNAISRVASVFANAIMGALAVVLFSAALQTQLKDAKVPAQLKEQIIQQSANLGNAKPPKSTSKQLTKTVEIAYRQSFINAYGNVMRISAALALMGAFMALLLVKNEAVKSSDQSTSAENS